jgi:hypothetical protein
MEQSINNILLKQKEASKLLKNLGESLTIQKEFPNIFDNGSTKLCSYRKMFPYPSRDIGVFKAYLETDGKKFYISRELFTKLTGKNNFHPNYNTN